LKFALLMCARDYPLGAEA